MAEKRRLPVLQSKPAPTPAPQPEGEAQENPPPPWHWIGIDVLVSIVASAAVTRVAFLPFSRWRYAAALAGRDAAHLSESALQSLKLQLSLMGAVVILSGTFLGGLFIGRLGPPTLNARYGLLGGLATTLLLLMLSGARMDFVGLVGAVLMVPMGALSGRLGAAVGLRLRRSP